jgi:hypothetical protein
MMDNPGLDVFAAATTYAERPANHPLWDDIREGDPDYDPDHEEDPSDYVAPKEFGRWRTPGQTRIPTIVGPKFHPEETPSDVIHGEVISPEEENGADHILNGEHESDHPSTNPYVEEARQDLKTTGSAIAVETLSGLLRGGRPEDVGELDETHDYLRRHFTGVRVNPHQGVLQAQSQYGTQLVRRHANLPAVPGQPPPPPTYSLTNKHGEFKSEDHTKLVRTMIAFQILHNELGKKKDEEDKTSDGITTTSGFFDWLDRVHQEKSKPLIAPPGSKFEPGNGTDIGPGGIKGGWVTKILGAPSDWNPSHDEGVAYSPGHARSWVYNERKARTPIDDRYYPGHQFTYSPSAYTGHSIPIQQGNFTIYVDELHPLARAQRAEQRQGPGPTGRPRRRTQDQGQIGQVTTAPVSPAGPAAQPMTRRTPPPQPPRKKSAVSANDLCPVCVSGYLEPYDGDYHECLNCGSLVKHIGFEKVAAPRRRPGGLGKGLGQLLQEQDTSDPLNLANGGSEAEGFVAPEQSHHPLADEENATPEEEQFRARKRILDKQAEAEPITMDEHLGKFGYQPIHKDGELRAYLAEMPGSRDHYVRLTEHPNDKWVMTADTAPARDQWDSSRGGRPSPQRGSTLQTVNPVNYQQIGERQVPFPDQGDRAAPRKSVLAEGHHPVHDPELAKAIADVSVNGRDSQTYQRVLTNPFVAKKPPVPGPDMSQQHLRGLSSVENPGLTRFYQLAE